MRVLVAGMGNVGKAIFRLSSEANNVVVRVDKEGLDKPIAPVDVLHICFPYSEDFVSYVLAYMYQSKPKLTIIESTVPVGTTGDIFSYGARTLNIVHSPVRGKHSNIYRGLKQYTKFIGPCNIEALNFAKFYYQKLGLMTHSCCCPEETELLKLAGLASFAVNIGFMQELERKAKAWGVPMSLIDYWFNNTEEESGYTVERPHFFGGYIGGSCVMQGTRKLFRNSKLLEWLEDSNAKALDKAE